ncbi:MAG: ABC transporter ATP-binding protein [Planctomycetaceae bacterium]|nr:ABC transporter ATP-binding protein [Planctomycetaceae bacterium]
MIDLKNVTKVYQLGDVEVHALRGVSLQIHAGEIVSLVGPSGSGKSTMMNMLGCLDRPTAGSCLLDGVAIEKLSADERAAIRNRKIGFVFQSFNLLSRTSALENVELPMMYSQKLTAKQRRKRAEDLLELVDLKDRHDHFPSQLSGGQQQRVAIARALANDPPILLADEPTGNLDSKTGGDVLRLFHRLNREKGLTIIIVTHDHHVARATRRQIVMRDGQVLIDTTDAEEAIRAINLEAGIQFTPVESEAVV